MTLNPFVSRDFALAAARRHTNSRDDLDRRRCVIGNKTLMIAAIALANGLTVLTGNAEEFGRVPRLRVEDWSV